MLKNALESNTKLEADVERMMVEGDAFRTQLLKRDFDIAHTVALKNLLDGRVEDLERTIAAHDDAVSAKICCFARDGSLTLWVNQKVDGFVAVQKDQHSEPGLSVEISALFVLFRRYHGMSFWL